MEGLKCYVKNERICDLCFDEQMRFCLQYDCRKCFRVKEEYTILKVEKGFLGLSTKVYLKDSTGRVIIENIKNVRILKD